MFSLNLIVVNLILIKSSLAWPSGAPEKACASLSPSHGINQAKSLAQSPFTLTQSSLDYHFGGKVKGKFEIKTTN